MNYEEKCSRYQREKDQDIWKTVGELPTETAGVALPWLCLDENGEPTEEHTNRVVFRTEPLMNRDQAHFRYCTDPKFASEVDALVTGMTQTVTNHPMSGVALELAMFDRAFVYLQGSRFLLLDADRITREGEICYLPKEGDPMVMSPVSLMELILVGDTAEQKIESGRQALTDLEEQLS